MTDPLPGVEYFHPNLPYTIADWLFIDDGSALITQWIDPTFTGVQINPGEILLIYSFTYLGGETQLDWDPNSEMCETMTLIDGCVCGSFPILRFFM